MPPELASSVPREILVNVLAPLLEPSDLAPLRAVCQDWRDAFSDPEVWLNKLTSLVATFTSCDLEQAEGEPHMAWHARRAAVVAAPERRRDGLVRPRSRPCGPGPGLRLRPVYGRTRRPTTPPEARRSARQRTRLARRARRTPAASAAATGRRPRRPRCVRDVALLGGGARRPGRPAGCGGEASRGSHGPRVCAARCAPERARGVRWHERVQLLFYGRWPYTRAQAPLPQCLAELRRRRLGDLGLLYFGRAVGHDSLPNSRRKPHIRERGPRRSDRDELHSRASRLTRSMSFGAGEASTFGRASSSSR